MEQTGLTIAELEVEEVELLPARQALGGHGGFNFANVWASNTAVAFNAHSFASLASASAQPDHRRHPEVAGVRRHRRAAAARGRDLRVVAAARDTGSGEHHHDHRREPRAGRQRGQPGSTRGRLGRSVGRSRPALIHRERPAGPAVPPVPCPCDFGGAVVGRRGARDRSPRCRGAAVAFPRRVGAARARCPAARAVRQLGPARRALPGRARRRAGGAPVPAPAPGRVRSGRTAIRYGGRRAGQHPVRPAAHRGRRRIPRRAQARAGRTGRPDRIRDQRHRPFNRCCPCGYAGRCCRPAPPGGSPTSSHRSTRRRSSPSWSAPSSPSRSRSSRPAGSCPRCTRSW